MHNNTSSAVSKVPELTLAFWVIKILATTLGETGGDAVSMSMDLGYLVSTGIFAVIFFVAVSAQISAKTYKPALYWATIIATTTVGTTLADFADRSLGIGYAGGSTILALLLLGSFAVWYRAQGEISSSVISSPRTEMFYWITIMFSQTLGTALGDWTADNAGFGYAGSSVVFGGILLAIVATYFLTNISRTFLFWAAFIITRPLGAVVGDFLDKPISKGGLELSRYSASVALLVAIAALVYISTLKSKRNDPVELDLDSEG
ncbi:COG4705 family protein [Aeromonas piscicola]|uniref:COG4705 family protein n=1 Tax=Aeromonas piscicola TaxID=600645 RepID=UPI0005B41854|nr:membrane protein [Aeromonas piscicola]